MVIYNPKTPTETGSASALNQALILAELKLKADLTEAQPVSAVSLPLPAWAATSIKQLADDHNVTVSNMIAAIETWLAKVANQLPDNHNVNVSNMIPAVETWLSTSANQTNWTQIVRLYDWVWNPITSLDWAIDIHDADVHTELVSLSFMQETATNTTIATTQNALDTSITVVDWSWFAINDVLTIKEWNMVLDDHFTVTAKPSTNVITLDAPIDIALTSVAVVTKVLHEMNVAWTLVANSIFSIAPPADEEWHITRVLLTLTDSTVMDDALFWWAATLTNWVLLRSKKNWVYKTIGKWKSNADIAWSMYDIEYANKAPAWSYWLRWRWTFLNSSVVIELNWETWDELQCVIQDSLVGLDDFHLVWQGHKEVI